MVAEYQLGMNVTSPSKHCIVTLFIVTEFVPAYFH